MYRGPNASPSVVKQSSRRLFSGVGIVIQLVSVVTCTYRAPICQNLHTNSVLTKLHTKHSRNRPPSGGSQTPFRPKPSFGDCSNKARQVFTRVVTRNDCMVRNRPQLTVTVSPELKAYLQQNHINASGLIEDCCRTQNHVTTEAINRAARDAGVGRYADDNDGEDQ